jgi:hypothetical protein
MGSGQHRAFNLKGGKHTSTSDFTSSGGTLIQFEPEGEPGFKPVPAKKLERGSMNANGVFQRPLAGPLELGTHNLEFVLRGVSSNAGGAIAVDEQTEVGQILDSLTGTDAVVPAGAVASASGGSGTSLTLSGSPTNYLDGMGVLFSNGTVNVAREIVSGGGTSSLVLDRTSGGTPSGNVIRSARWTIDPSIIHHKHSYFLAEGQDWYRAFYGCMGTGKITCSLNDYARLVTSWMPTDVDDVVEDNPTFTAPTTGNAIVGVNSTMYIGSTSYTVRDIDIDFGGEVKARGAHNSPHGVLGYGVFNKLPKISGKLYLDPTSGIGGITDSAGTMDATIGQGTSLATGAALTTFDIGIQIGNAAGACLYVRAPLASFTKFEFTSIDGFDGYSFEASCYGPTSGSPLRIHLF